MMAMELEEVTPVVEQLAISCRVRGRVPLLTRASHKPLMFIDHVAADLRQVVANAGECLVFHEGVSEPP